MKNRTSPLPRLGVIITITILAIALAIMLSPSKLSIATNYDDQERPWPEITIDDLHFIRATLRENHPGPTDKLNTWFRDWYEQGFDEATAIANEATGCPGYYYAIQYYMQGFQDGHLGALGDYILQNSQLNFRWPGFVVAYRSGEFQVVESEVAHLPVGATLILLSLPVTSHHCCTGCRLLGSEIATGELQLAS